MPYILHSYVPTIHWTLISLTFSMEECSRFLWNIGTYHTADYHIWEVPIIIYHNDNLIYPVYIIGNKCVVLQVYLEYPHDHTPGKSQGYHSSLPGTVLPPPSCCLCTSPQQMLGCHRQQ